MRPRILRVSNPACSSTRTCFDAPAKLMLNGRRQFSDRAFPLRQMAKHGAARRIGKGMKNGVEMC